MSLRGVKTEPLEGLRPVLETALDAVVVMNDDGVERCLEHRAKCL